MPDIMLLVVIVVVVGAVVIAYKVLASLFKAFFIISAFLFVISAIAGVIVFKDALDFKNRIALGSSMLLLSDREGKKLITGIISTGNSDQDNTGHVNGNVQALSDDKIQELNAHFATADYAAMLEGTGQLIIIDENSITESMPQTIRIGNQNISKDVVLQQLESGDAEARAAMFSALFSMKSAQDPVFLVRGYKEGRITIYPEMSALKAVKMIPLPILTKLSGGLARLVR